MGRHNGVWSPVYGQVWAHPKTTKAAAWIVANVRRTSGAVAPFLVVGWLNRLNIWCLDNHSRGSLHGLSEARVGVLAWPEAVEEGMAAAKAGRAVLGALEAGGFLDPGPAIHDFEDVHAPILRRRGINLDLQHQREAGLRSAAARRDRHGTAQPTNNRTDPEPITEPITEPYGSSRSPDRTVRTDPEPSDRTGPDRTVPDTQSARARAPGPQEPGAGRPQPDPGPPTTANAAAQPLDVAAVAHALELRIGCSYQQAAKAVQVVQAAGASLEWILERAMAAAPPEAPWAWRDRVAETWKQRDAKPWVPFLGRASRPVQTPEDR